MPAAGGGPSICPWAPHAHAVAKKCRSRLAVVSWPPLARPPRGSAREIYARRRRELLDCKMLELAPVGRLVATELLVIGRRIPPRLFVFPAVGVFGRARLRPLHSTRDAGLFSRRNRFRWYGPRRRGRGTGIPFIRQWRKQTGAARQWDRSLRHLWSRHQ